MYDKIKENNSKLTEFEQLNKNIIIDMLYKDIIQEFNDDNEKIKI
jgi:hypothetical protein